MMDAPQYSELLLPSDCDNDAELTSMMKRPDTSSDHEEYKTGSHQGSFNLHEVISTAVTVEESCKEEVGMPFRKLFKMEPSRVYSMRVCCSVA
eukprot:scaffold61318_cov54-Attheya_sp.AAC.1